MTTPGSHNDTYASSCHRLFFQNWVQKVDPTECPGNDGHNIDSIDALTLTVPVILKHSGSSKEDLYRKVEEVIRVSRRVSPQFHTFSHLFADILTDLLAGKDLRTALEANAQASLNYSVKESVMRVKQDPMVACYID